MKCLVCGKNYIAVGVHAKHKHGLTADEYRHEFGLMKSHALVDEELSAHLSKKLTQRLAADPDMRAACVAQCQANTKGMTGRRWKIDMPADTVKAAQARNKRRNEAYLLKKSAQVKALLTDKPSLHHVRKSIGMSAIAAKKIIAMGLASYCKKEALAQRLKDATATHQRKRNVRVAEYKKHLGKAQSAAEMCQIAGITIKTYKNWLAAGVIAKHPNTSGHGIVPVAADC